MSKRGIVLTGTNMSGKSTFLRMLGVNMLFAQAFNFVLAEKYEGPIFSTNFFIFLCHNIIYIILSQFLLIKLT